MESPDELVLGCRIKRRRKRTWNHVEKNDEKGTPGRHHKKRFLSRNVQ
ncbi:hypothetical protein B4098_1344 [Heyndrickxia coagulans]|uniref:Uncharacterized protein n=1 Tax=Heyndrickxia coagulans TaxID=1398 RepID=A0A150KDA8_HEYCO|nr:hypothetical protein B4098_1344 [Heyndrickxia coagulans]